MYKPIVISIFPYTNVAPTLNSHDFESKFTTESLVFTLKILLHITESCDFLRISRFEIFLG